MGCDPADHPTAQYIADHANAYSNPNLTTWAQAGYEFPVRPPLPNMGNADRIEKQTEGWMYVNPLIYGLEENGKIKIKISTRKRGG